MESQSSDTAVLRAELKGVREDVAEVKAGMQDISRAILTLALVEQRQSTHQERLDGLDRDVREHADRIAEVERDMPGLKDLRRWVIAGVAAVALAASGAFLNGNLTVTVGPKAPAAARS